jgi:hypothetical protein
MLSNIPAELRSYNNFVLWRYEERGTGKPTKVPYSVKGYMANVNKPGDWSDFDTAANVLANTGDQYAGLGFVLSDNDPFAMIDLDNPYEPEKNYSEEQSNEILQRQIKIHEMFASYAERSPSGKGLHILCKGSVAQGRKRAQVEVYSTQRFMTVTGDVFNNSPIEDRNDLLNELWGEMSKGVKVYTDIGDQPQTMEDFAVCDMAANAVNGAKFLDLYNGQWQHMYSSQSEADFALIDIFAFYTQNRAQIMRLFRMSALGQREKAFRDHYLEHMILRSFDHQLPPINIEGLRLQLEAALLAKKAADAKAIEEAERVRSDTVYPDVSTVSDTQQNDYRQDAPALPVGKNKTRRYPLPPGLLGDICSFIEEAAPRPVYEIALAGAIGLMSGICGRAYNVSRTGLNQYTLLIAPTGTGKEAIASGIDRLMDAVSQLSHNCKSFIGPGDISSSQALAKHFHRHSKSFVAMPGEVGLWLQRICGPFAGPADVGVMRSILQLYSVSGQGQTFKAQINSQKENSTDETVAPAFSILGESTPEQFYSILDDSMVASGLLPRFTVIEYLGKRQPRNRNAAKAYPKDHLIKGLATVCTNAYSLNEINQVIEVGYTPEGEAMLDAWDKHCDDEINMGGTSGEVRKQLWNRGHLRALKLAGLVAVGINPYSPLICEETAKWAIRIVNDDILALLGRFEAGETGADSFEARQMADMINVFKDYLLRPYSDLEKYVIHPGMHAERVIPFSFLQRRLSSHGSYKTDRQGVSGALKRTIQTLLDRGDIAEVPRGELKNKFDTVMRSFMVTIPRTFGL